MAVLPPLEKQLLQSRESDADAEMSSSSLSEEDALEYDMSEDLEDSPAVTCSTLFQTTKRTQIQKQNTSCNNQPVESLLASVAPLCENTSASQDLTDFKLVTKRKKLKKDSPSKTNSISTAEKISKFYTTSSPKVTNPIPTKDNISSLSMPAEAPTGWLRSTQHYFRTRTIEDRLVTYVNVLDLITVEVCQGCPKGSDLAPHIWNFYFNEILFLSNDHKFLQAYADALALLVVADSRKKLELEVSSSLDILSDKLYGLNLEVASKKTLAVVFRSSRNKNKQKMGLATFKRTPIFKIKGGTILEGRRGSSP
ncbi:hypothetical protein AVEN_151102-1 [Araneus ventricosus]|uniref:Reverse transcriptase domain-containing protein n=1 Tax=Araneus ventricosus TaxID=182803 RepID=A0A4Y2Q6R1_ARAVE|nr:hypothetical protein AVEN_151102-1 [Araneus ventricosus]